MSAPPVKLLWAPLPWPLSIHLAGSLSGRVAPRLPRTSTTLVSISDWRTQAIAVPSPASAARIGRLRGDASVHSVGSRGSLLFGVHSSPIGVQSRTSQGEHSVASDQIRGNSPRTQACFERDPAPPPSLLEKSVRIRLSRRHAVSIISGETQRSDCLQGAVKLSEGRAKGDFPRATIRR